VEIEKTHPGGGGGGDGGRRQISAAGKGLLWLPTFRAKPVACVGGVGTADRRDRGGGAILRTSLMEGH